MIHHEYIKAFLLEYDLKVFFTAQNTPQLQAQNKFIDTVTGTSWQPINEKK